MTAPVNWRVGVRFRLQKRLRIEGKECRLEVANQVVVLSPIPDMKIAEATLRKYIVYYTVGM